MQDPSRQHSPVSSPSPMSTESMQKTKMSDTDFNMTEAGDLRPRRPDTRDLSTATSRDQVEKLKDRIEPQLNDTRSGLRRNHDSEERMCEEVEARLSDKSQNRPSGKISRFFGFPSAALSKTIVHKHIRFEGNDEGVDLRRQNARLEQECREMAQQVEQFEQEQADLEKQNRIQANNEDVLKRQCDDLKAKNAALSTRLKEMKLDNHKLEERVGSFRDMMLKKHGENACQIDDNTIIKQFINLRAQIQKIVNKYYPVDINSPPVRNTINKDYCKFWGQGLNAKEIKDRIRGLVFYEINEYILSARTFGLEGPESSSQAVASDGLAQFEMGISSIDQDQQVEWRLQTVKCAKLARVDSSLPGDLANHIQEFMNPLLPASPDRAKMDLELRELLGRLCKDALSFTLLLRGCRDTYQCMCPAVGSRVDEEEAEPQSQEGSRGADTEGQTVVACVIFGMLEKYSEHSPSEALVLEKAHVNVREA